MTAAGERHVATVAEIARLANLNTSAVYRNIARADLEPVGKEKGASVYEVEPVLDAILRAQKRDSRNVGGNLRDQKMALEIDLLEIRRRHALGELIEAARVRARVFAVARATREALLAVPENVADMLAAESTPDRVEALLSEELRDALDALASRMLDALATEPEEDDQEQKDEDG